jgi:hypothetical protein
MYVREITQLRPDLESVFLQLTKDDTLRIGARPGSHGANGGAA